MSELINNLDIAVRLSMLIEIDLDEKTRKLCEDALEEIERLRAENKKMKYLARL